MKLHLGKPSPAMVVACISLFIGLSGVSTAAVVVLKKNSVLSKHIKNGQVQSVDVKDSSLLAQDFAAGQLPAGQGNPGATGATGATGAAGASFTWRGAFDCNASYAPRDVVFDEGSAWITNQGIGGCVDPPAAPWELMASQGAPGPLITPETWKEVGTSGQPAFITQTCFDPGPFDYFPMTWTNYDVNHNSLAFYKDPFGRVHLKGLIKNGSTFDHGTDISGSERCGKIFQLPAGYRPAKREVVATITYFTTNGIRVSRVNIDPNGLVWAGENATQTWFSLDNISFRAAG